MRTLVTSPAGKAAGDYLVGILNASLSSQSFNISSFIGTMTNLTELSLGASGDEPVWATGRSALKTYNGGAVRQSLHVFGGDIALFRVQVARTNTFRCSRPTAAIHLQHSDGSPFRRCAI